MKKRQLNNEAIAAVAAALHMYMDDCVHDKESNVITIRRTPSEWCSKRQNFRQMPVRK